MGTNDPQSYRCRAGTHSRSVPKRYSFGSSTDDCHYCLSDVDIPSELIMDEIEMMVSETYKHFHEHYAHEVPSESAHSLPPKEIEHELPVSPGLLYHIQKGASVFVVRSFVSKSIKDDYKRIIENPEEFPSLRLLEGGAEDLEKKLRYFMVEDHVEAEVIHDQISNRRFPIHEEMMCNLSDPGFSWWLVKKPIGFQVSFNISITDGTIIKLGPLGDQQLALRSFQEMQNLLNEAGFELNIQNEANRVQFSDGEELIMAEFKDLFELGVLGEGTTKLFKLLSRRVSDQGKLETMWYYLQEVASIRRFWIQVQYDLEA